MVAAGAPGRATGGGGGAKFWAAAGSAAASIRTATASTRSMLYYRRMRRPLLALAVLLSLAVAAHAAPAAPGFRVKLIGGGRSIDSRELIGKKIIVLRFQASYCRPCVKESPALAKIAERYRDRDVEFIAIHVQDTLADTKRFIDRTKATYPIAMDPRLNMGNRFGFKGTPYTVVIDKKGEMVVQLHGESAVSRLPRMLDGLLKRDQP
jgi:thiol-disulfide isomerase/thioredoxin